MSEFLYLVLAQSTFYFILNYVSHFLSFQFWMDLFSAPEFFLAEVMSKNKRFIFVWHMITWLMYIISSIFWWICIYNYLLRSRKKIRCMSKLKFKEYLLNVSVSRYIIFSKYLFLVLYYAQERTLEDTKWRQLFIEENARQRY